MKIVKFNGGLGNQLFEYAFGLAVEDYYKEEVYYDVSNYNLKTHLETSRPFLLNKYNTHLKFARKKERKKCINENSKLKNKVNKLFKKEIFKEKSNRIIEKHAQIYDENMFLEKENIYFEGFFQSEKYFKHIRKKVLENFTLKESLDEKNTYFLNKILNSTSISLHIRRGDYLLCDCMENCNLDYYYQGIDYIKQKINNNIEIFIFSDDIPWVKENLKIADKVNYIDINNDAASYCDIELMRNCKHNIIANSSFSWWGAWLNNNPNKIVIAPRIWFKNEPQYDIIPEEWIKI